MRLHITDQWYQLVDRLSGRFRNKFPRNLRDFHIDTWREARPIHLCILALFISSVARVLAETALSHICGD